MGSGEVAIIGVHAARRCIDIVVVGGATVVVSGHLSRSKTGQARVGMA